MLDEWLMKDKKERKRDIRREFMSTCESLQEREWIWKGGKWPLSLGPVRNKELAARETAWGSTTFPVKGVIVGSPCARKVHE